MLGHGHLLPSAIDQRACLSQLGLSLQLLLPHTFSANHARIGLRDCLSSGGGRSRRTFIRDGQFRRVHSRYFPIADRAGRVEGTIGRRTRFLFRSLPDRPTAGLVHEGVAEPQRIRRQGLSAEEVELCDGGGGGPEGETAGKAG